MAAVILYHWILLGPLFDVFWRTRSFDIHYDKRLEAGINTLITWIKNVFQRHLAFYERNFDRLKALRENSKQRLEQSKTCFGINYATNFVQQRIGKTLLKFDLDTIEDIAEDPGWDPLNHCLDAQKLKLVDPHELLITLSNIQPAYALCTNMYSSMFQLYVGSVSPFFILKRAGIHIWNIMIDQPLYNLHLYSESFSKAWTGSYSLISINHQQKSPKPIFDDPVFFPAPSYPDIFREGYESSHRRASNHSHNVEGVLYATNLRTRYTYDTPAKVREILFRFISKAYSSFNCNTEEFLEFLWQYEGLIFAMLLHSQKYVEIENLLNWFTQSRLFHAGTTPVKIAVLAAIEDICKKNNIPFKFYSGEDWQPAIPREGWMGYGLSEEITELEKNGWLRISPNRQSWGQPYGEMKNALDNGMLCSGLIQNNDKNAKHYDIMSKCCFYDRTSMENMLNKAIKSPVDFRNAMEEAFWSQEDEHSLYTQEEKIEIVKNFRRSPEEPIYPPLEVYPAKLDKIPKDLLCLFQDLSLLEEFINAKTVDAFVEEMIQEGVSPRFMQLHRAYWRV